MLPEEVEKIKPALKHYVEKSSEIVNLQWDQDMTIKLRFDPYTKSTSQRKNIAHYFLLVASINETELVGRAENCRALMIHLHTVLGGSLFKQSQPESFAEIIQKSDIFDQLPTLRDCIPEILASTNHFVQRVAGGDMIQYAKDFVSPEEMVNEIGDNITRMRGRYIDKSWIYMRWMVRRFPDLEIFTNFSSQDLQVPMTSCIRSVACCLGLCSDPKSGWEDVERAKTERKRFTEFAASNDMFPEDPAIVDYPLYVLGRWIRGEQLTPQTLRNYLQFWKRVYDRIHRPPVAFDVISRKESPFEQEIRAELKKLQFMFSFEPHVLKLPKGGAPQYTPDFVLPSCKINGKSVILEPHGFWTPREKRIVRIGRKAFPIWAYPERVHADELRFVDKLRAFRKTYREIYYLVLIVPSTVKDRIEKDYPDIFDEIYEGSDVPRLLYKLKERL